MLKKLWEKYSLYAGILGLIVDCLTLWGYIGVKFNIQDNNGASTIQIIPANTITIAPIHLQRFLFISTAAAIIFAFIVLVLYLPRKGYYHLCDYRKSPKEKAENGRLTVDEIVGLFDMHQDDRIGLAHTFYGIGIYSFMLNILIVSPVALIWTRVFLRLPSDDYLFFATLVSLSFTSANLLFLEKLNNQFSTRSHIVESVVIVEVLVILIFVYSFTNWSILITLGFLFFAVLAIAIYWLIAKMFREKVIFFELADEWTVPPEALINWAQNKLNDLEKK